MTLSAKVSLLRIPIRHDLPYTAGLKSNEMAVGSMLRDVSATV